MRKTTAEPGIFCSFLYLGIGGSRTGFPAPNFLYASASMNTRFSKRLILFPPTYFQTVSSSQNRKNKYKYDVTSGGTEGPRGHKRMDPVRNNL